jgi:hypothetical protein
MTKQISYKYASQAVKRAVEAVVKELGVDWDSFEGYRDELATAINNVVTSYGADAVDLAKESSEVERIQFWNHQSLAALAASDY